MSVLAASRVGEQSSAYRYAMWLSAPGGRIRTDAATAATSSAQDGRCLVAVVTATATCTAFRAVEERTGGVVTSRVPVERVGFLAALTQAMSAAVVAARWNDGDLGRVGSGVGLDGRALPSKGWMALRRLGWGAGMPEGVYVSDRVRRVAEEAAARVLRLAVHRQQILEAILAAWPPILGGAPTQSGWRCANVSPGARAARRSAIAPGRCMPGRPTTPGGSRPA